MTSRLPPDCPIVAPTNFPTVPPSPIHLTDDLFSALSLRPLFFRHVGNPESAASGSASGSGKREWIKPPRTYDSLVVGLPGKCLVSEHSDGACSLRFALL